MLRRNEMPTDSANRQWAISPIFRFARLERLLTHIGGQLPTITQEVTYLLQNNKTLPEIAQIYADKYREWAWYGGGRAGFPDDLFHSNQPSDIYLKYKVAEFFESILPTNIETIKSGSYGAEIEALQGIQPHAVITTNYDRMLEMIFPDYVPIIGQSVLRTNNASIGEIFKIHGSASVPTSLVLTESDYRDFMETKQYLSAKLLAYFAEHPLLIIGYSINDKNINAILEDIDRILAPNGETVPNIYHLQRDQNMTDNSYPPTDYPIFLEKSKHHIRVKAIRAKDWEWVFAAFQSTSTIRNVDIRLLRALLARTFELIEYTIPRGTMAFNYQTLEEATRTQEEFANVYGVVRPSHYTPIDATHPYILSKVAKELGYTNWFYAKQLIAKITDAKGVDIMESNNKYHVSVSDGSDNLNPPTHRYSEAAVELLEKVKNDQPYELDL